MIPAALTAALAFAGAAGALCVAAACRWRATAHAAATCCALAYFTAAATVIAGAVHA